MRQWRFKPNTPVLVVVPITYVMVGGNGNVRLPPGATVEIERALKLTESIIRHLLVRAEGLTPAPATAASQE